MDKAYPNKTAEIELLFPITVGGAEVGVLKMRRPTVRDRLLFDKESGSEVEKELSMMARLCDMDSEDLHNLDADDYEALQEQFQAFRSRSKSGKSND